MQSLVVNNSASFEPYVDAHRAASFLAMPRRTLLALRAGENCPDILLAPGCAGCGNSHL
jgi:hypothetical protein